MIINTRADLEAVRGTALYDEFVDQLVGSTVRRTNVADYPEEYDHGLQPGDEGYIEPVWEEVDDFSIVKRMGFGKTDIERLRGESQARAKAGEAKVKAKRARRRRAVGRA